MLFIKKKTLQKLFRKQIKFVRILHYSAKTYSICIKLFVSQSVCHLLFVPRETNNLVFPWDKHFSNAGDRGTLLFINMFIKLFWLQKDEFWLCLRLWPKHLAPLVLYFLCSIRQLLTLFLSFELCPKISQQSGPLSFYRSLS